MLFLLFLSAKLSLKADDQAWVNNSASFKASSRFSLKLSNEMRYYDITGLHPYLKNIQGGIVCNLPRNTYLAFLYKRELTEKTEGNHHENRYTLESGWKMKISRIFDFDIRFRTEFREFVEELSKDHLRFRIRARIRTKLTIGSLKLRPFIATEPFADTLSDRIFRNRFYLGTIFPMGDHVELAVNYIRQDTRNKEINHILNTGFALKF